MYEQRTLVIKLSRLRKFCNAVTIFGEYYKIVSLSNKNQISNL